MWFKLSFVERPAHRTVQWQESVVLQQVFFTKLKNIEANTDICNVSWSILKRFLKNDVFQSFSFAEHPVNKTVQ